MTEQKGLRQYHFKEFRKCDLKIADDDTSLKFLISEYTRLAQLDPDDYNLNWPATSFYKECNHVSLHIKNILTLTYLTEAPNSFFKGRFFLCRTITPSIKRHSLMMVVQFPDPTLKNRGAFLSLCNYLHPLDVESKSCLPILSPGTILAIKNPLFLRSSTDPIYAIKCDNPADVVILDDHKFNQLFPKLKWSSSEPQNEENSLVTRPCWNWWRTVKDWKAVAHLRLQKNNYVGALEAYASALDSNPRDIEALSLRGALYLRLKVYQRCLENAEIILEMDNSHKKSICHKALSMIGLRQYNGAIEFLKWHIQKCTTSDQRQKVELMEIVFKAKTWRKQGKFGEYDVVKMLECPSTFIHDCADYIGNVEQQEILGKGLGMVAKADIKCGELIIATKAFAMAHLDDADSKPMRVLDLATKEVRTHVHLNLVACVAHRLIVDPELGKELYRLYDGTERSASKQLRDTMDYTCIDMRRISAICDNNGYCGDSETFRHEIEEAPEGLWPFASYFNHSCFDANSTWTICGDFIFIRACKWIKKYEEITLPYISCTSPYLLRRCTFSNYGFVCECTLCLLDAKDTDAIHIRREEILREIRTLNAESKFFLLETLIQELRDQRPDDPKRNIYMVQPLFKLARIYMTGGHYDSAAKILHSLHDSVFDTVMTEIAIKSCCYAIWCYMNCKQINEAETLVIALKSNLIQQYGTDSKEMLKHAMLKFAPKAVAETMMQYELNEKEFSYSNYIYSVLM